MRRLTADECYQMMAEKDVPVALRSSRERVAVVLTQQWCADWKLMRRYLQKVDDTEIDIVFVEYDQESFFEEFKTFKESVFKNPRLPYIRYYRDGELVNESNLVLFKKWFLRKFE